MATSQPAFLGPIAALIVGCLCACGNPRERELDALQARCSPNDADYSQQNVDGCTALLAAPDLDPPVRGMTYNIRGNTYSKLRKHDLAIADYLEVTRLMPDFPYGYANIGLQYLYKGEPEKALPYYEQALRVSPNNSYSRYGKGVALGRLGRADEAAAELDAANGADPEVAKLYREIGVEPSP